MQPYTVADYIPYEYWFDEDKGPKLVQRLSRIFKKESFPVYYDDESDESRRDLACIWHQHIYQPLLEQEKKFADWYDPQYTKEQLENMATFLDNFVGEIG